MFKRKKKSCYKMGADQMFYMSTGGREKVNHSIYSKGHGD